MVISQTSSTTSFRWRKYSPLGVFVQTLIHTVTFCIPLGISELKPTFSEASLCELVKSLS